MLDIFHVLFSNCIILEDTEIVNGVDLFVAFLKYFREKNSADKIQVVCLENTPEFYFRLGSIEKSDKFIIYNFFNDSHSWNNHSLDIISVISNYEKFSKTILFFDSLTHLVIHFGFNTVYKILFNLKLKAKKIFCLVHCDLISSNQIHELKSLSTTYVKVKKDLTSFSSKKSSKKNKFVEVTYKQNNSKPLTYSLLISLESDFSFSISQDYGDSMIKRFGKTRKKLKALTTFKLGLTLSENEEKARNQLILPFLRTSQIDKSSNKMNSEEFEDDPDDDLDF